LRVVRGFIHFVDSTNRGAARIGVGLILIVVLVGSLEVVLRDVFNNPTSWAWELNSMILCVYIVLSGGYTTLVDGHVRMDLIYHRLSPRGKALVDLFLSFLFFAFVGVLLWFLIKLGWQSLMIREHSFSMWAPPLYPAKLLLPVAVLLVLLQGIAIFIRNLNTVFRWNGGVQ